MPFPFTLGTSDLGRSEPRPWRLAGEVKPKTPQNFSMGGAMASGRRSAVQHRTPEEWMNAVTTPNPLATLHLSVEGQEGTL